MYFRWIYERFAKSVAMVVPKPLILTFKSFVRKQLHGQGMGRHSTEEITKKMVQDLTALTAQLGEVAVYWLIVS